MRTRKVVVGATALLGAVLGALAGCKATAPGIAPELLLMDARSVEWQDCPDSGTQLIVGLDTNGNSWLDPSEPSLHRDTCGLPLRAALREAPAQPGCAAGGVWLSLDTPQPQGTSHRQQLWCHAGGSRLRLVDSPVASGVQMSDGPSRLLRVEADLDGLCPVTGRRVSSGLDSNRNGRLDDAEVELVQHLCGDAEPVRQWASSPSQPASERPAPAQGETRAAARPLTLRLPQDVPVGRVMQVQGPRGTRWHLAQEHGHRIATRSLLPAETSAGHKSAWEELARPTSAMRARHVVQSADGRSILLASDEGLWISTDAGQSWQTTGPDAQLRWSHVASSADGQFLLASAPSDGLYGSDDGGKTWQRRSLGHGFSQLVSSADGRRAAAVRHGLELWVSDNRGQDWRATGQTGRWQALGLSANGLVMLAAAKDQPLQLSRDGGETWLPSLAEGTPTSLAVSADGKTLLAGQADKATPLRWSRDGGKTWQSVPIPAPRAGVRSLAVAAGGARWLLAGTDGSTWLTHDHAEHWHRQNTAGTVQQVVMSPEGLQQLALGEDGSVLRMSAATSPGANGGLQVAAGAPISIRYRGTGMWAVESGQERLHAH